MTVATHSECETECVAYTMGLALRPGDVLLLSGPMGSGKTVFVRGLARSLGCKDDVSSPTFALMHVYDGGRIPLQHFDLYRLSCAEEVRELGIPEILAGVISVIEWPDIAVKLIDVPCIRVAFQSPRGDNERIITIEGEEERGLSGD